VLGITKGGTGTALTAPPNGGIVYSDGSQLQVSSAGANGQVLFSTGASAPTWLTVPASLVYPPAGIPNSTGSAWGASYGVSGTGTVALTSNPVFATDITVNGITVGRGDGNIASNTAFGVDALGSPAITASNINNVAIGYNALNDVDTGVATVTITNGGSGYNDDGNDNFTYSATCTFVSGAAATVYPTLTLTVASGIITNAVVTNKGYGFTNGSPTVMTVPDFAGYGGSGAVFNIATYAIAANNTAIGYEAGINNRTGANSIYIGSNVGGTGTNEIAIGGPGSGDNTATIGNSSTNITYIKGVATTGTLQGDGDFYYYCGTSKSFTVDTNNIGGVIIIGGETGTQPITIGRSTGAQTVNIANGAGTATKTVNIGRNSTGGSTSINIGTISGGTTTCNIGGGATTNTVNIGTTTGTATANIATGASTSTKTVAIGTGNTSGATNITIGATAGTSTTTINGAVTLSATTQAINIGNSQSSGVINIGTANSRTGAINIGTGAGGLSAGNITIGDSAGQQVITLGRTTEDHTVNIATGVAGASNTKTVNIATNSPLANTNINIGSSAVTSNINFQGISYFNYYAAFGNSINQNPVTVASLPSVIDAVIGDRNFVNDALAPRTGSTVVGGGSVAMPVYYNGTNWICDAGLGATTGTGSVVLSASPTLTGTVQLPNSSFVSGTSTIGYAGNVSVGDTNYLTNNTIQIGGNEPDSGGGAKSTINIGADYVEIGESSASATTTNIYGDVVFPAAVASESVIFNKQVSISSNGTLSVLGGLTAGSSLNLTSNGTSNNNIATSQTSGSLTIGGASATGAITLGRSTVTQAVNMGTGATASGSTKTVNIGINGLAGSTTNIIIGSTAGTGTTTINAGTGTQTVDIANGITASGSTKTINIGSKGASGSITRIYLGSTTNPTTSEIYLNGFVTFSTSIAQTPVAVASLPSGANAFAGDRNFVNNALAPTFGSAVVGGGAVNVPVYYDGTTWRVG
jgi:hypothetical protein